MLIQIRGRSFKLRKWEGYGFFRIFIKTISVQENMKKNDLNFFQSFTLVKILTVWTFSLTVTDNIEVFTLK